MECGCHRRVPVQYGEPVPTLLHLLRGLFVLSLLRSSIVGSLWQMLRTNSRSSVVVRHTLCGVVSGRPLDRDDPLVSWHCGVALGGRRRLGLRPIDGIIMIVIIKAR